MNNVTISFLALILVGFEVALSHALLPTRQDNYSNRYQRSAFVGRTPFTSNTSPLGATSNASFHSYSSQNPDYQSAVLELLELWTSPRDEEQALAFLFVNQKHSASFKEIVKDVSEKLGKQTSLLSLIGGGIINGCEEIDDADVPSMSLLGGILPKGAQVTTFSVQSDDDESTKIPSSALSSNSHIVFSDPFCTKITQVLQLLDKGANNDNVKGNSVVAGGISVPPTMMEPSVSLQGKVLDPGALIGVSLSGTVGLQAIVAQGCRPVGPTFTITEMRAHAIAELDSKPALEQLEKTAEEANEVDKSLIRDLGILGGVVHNSRNGQGFSEETQQPEEVAGDFLIRQVIGFRPQSGSFLVAGGHQLKVGDSFRFHVRAPDAALDDMELMVQRAKTERLVLGSQRMGMPLGALQISCVARGKSLYGRPNVDLSVAGGLLENSSCNGVEATGQTETDDSEAGFDKEGTPPIAGFFANGEIGPVGIQMGSTENEGAPGNSLKSSTHLHGFTTIVCLLCEHQQTEDHSIIGASDPIKIEDAWG